MKDQVMFKNGYTVSRKTYDEWEKLHVLRGKKDLFFKILWLVFSLLALAWGIYVIRKDGGFPWVQLLIIAFCVIRTFVAPPMRMKLWQDRMIKAAGKEAWERTLFFGDYILMKENQRQAEFTYDKIDYVKEYDSWYAIVMKNKGIIYVSKKGFTLGNRDKFLGWLEEKRQEPPMAEEVEEA